MCMRVCVCISGFCVGMWPQMFVYNAGNKLMAIEWERINMFNHCFYNSSPNAEKLRNPHNGKCPNGWLSMGG